MQPWVKSWQALTGSGQSSNQKKERDGGKLKITPNFSFAKVEDRARGSSVCEQRNAALVRATLGEKEEVSA